MATFGLIMCFILLLSIQHLQNWMVRTAVKRNEIVMAGYALLIPAAMSFFLIMSIIKHLQK